MKILTATISGLAAAGLLAFAPANAAVDKAAPIELAYFVQDKDASLSQADLYTEARYHSRRSFRNRGFHSRRGYYGHRSYHRRYHPHQFGQRGFHRRSFDRNGFHDGGFRKRKRLHNKHGVVIKKKL